MRETLESLVLCFYKENVFEALGLREAETLALALFKARAYYALFRFYSKNAFLDRKLASIFLEKLSQQLRMLKRTGP